VAGSVVRHRVAVVARGVLSRLVRTSRVFVLAVALAGLVVASLGVAVVASTAAGTAQQRAVGNRDVLRAEAVVFVEVEAAEAGQRGFLLTGREDYLDPYASARTDISRQIDALAALVPPQEQDLVAALRVSTTAKLAELADTIALRRTGGLSAALDVVNNDQGRLLMGQVVSTLTRLDSAEQQALDESQRSVSTARAWTVVALSVGAGAALGGLVCLLGLVTLRRRADSARLQAEQDRAEMVGELTRLSSHDALTGLPNRRLLADRLEQALVRATPGTTVAVMLLDFDLFKQVNDKHGHRRGDGVLALAAHRMGEILRTGDTLARVGSDEFVAICEGLDARSDGHTVASRLRRAAAQPAEGISVDASVGIVFIDPEGAASEPVAARAERLLAAAAGWWSTSARSPMHTSATRRRQLRWVRPSTRDSYGWPTNLW